MKNSVGLTPLEATARRYAGAAGLRFSKSRRCRGWPDDLRYRVLKGNVLVDASGDGRLPDLVKRLWDLFKRQ